ncbi:hypothetical protein HMPREF0433_00223 [Gemella sanguinis M325]|uniref:Uncharacterized protein n=1 Tax=Gemella sanguinis TaxID=84135 RepID=A0ABX6FHC5_9BACL|nr:hypothetical protein [Gemella sanguinis]EGF89104.1 hypothetical protein HMPREF0433_00223 [Gemella sanguinis M325]QGS07900.1 hypothetical protein FOC50_06340 [Gemella sanguinis]
MENINLNALTNVERVLIEEDYDFYNKKYNSPLSNIKNNLTILFKNRELPVLDRVNFCITVSFFGDIYFRKDYVKITALRYLYKPSGLKIYYDDIRSIECYPKKCIIKYVKKGKEKEFSFYSIHKNYMSEGCKLLEKVYNTYKDEKKISNTYGVNIKSKLALS